jgi:16S rRNA (guanine(527)-N(7))-methyltransferase RsmG
MTDDLVTKLQQSLVGNDLFYYRPFSENEINRFSLYYRLILKWNGRLHLTTITKPCDFAERNLLESAFASQSLLDTVQYVCDIGSGAGFPGIPFAILRPDLSINLIESNQKKAIFLKEVRFALGINNLQILNQRFESSEEIGDNTCITTRALDDLSRLTPNILRYGRRASQFLFFGNTQLLEIIKMYSLKDWVISSHNIPLTLQRCIISLTRFT